jgi:hypothetical protein
MELRKNPFDVIRTEDFNSNYRIIAKYFSEPKATYYSSLKNRGNVILVGTRGSGKTMLLKSVFFPVHIETLKKEGKNPLTYPLDFIGILITCERYEFKIFRQNVFNFQMEYGDENKVKQFWKQCMGHYFALLIIEELLNTVISYGPSVGLDFKDTMFTKIAEEICNVCQLANSAISFESLGIFMKEERKKFSHLMNDSVLNIDYSIVSKKFDLSAVIETGFILNKIPRFKEARFYILLDDFFYPNLSDEQQKILLELIRVRSEPLAFKIATLPGGMVLTDDSGFELMSRGSEFIIESIEYPDLGENSEYYKLVKDVINNRLKDYSIKPENLFEESSDSIEYFLSKLKGEEKKGHVKPQYAGLNTLVHMSSGVIRTFLLLAKKILDEQLKQKMNNIISKDILPIPEKIQTDIINSESSLFLDSIGSMEKGFLISKLVHYIGNESRNKLLNNEVANENIQIQIKNPDEIELSIQEILTKAVTNNIFHSYQLAHRTTRRGIISVKSLILNRLLTPVLRIPFRDRWRMDLDVKIINNILKDYSPIDISYNKPVTQTAFTSLYCPVISGDCNKIDHLNGREGCFYASPIRGDWTNFAKDFFKNQISKFEVAIEHPPKGDLTCKICEMIHRNQFGIYELTDLNENVVFELALALSRKKHSFVVYNTEYSIELFEDILGVEYIPYQVVKEEIECVVRDKIIPIVKSNEGPWNLKTIEDIVSTTKSDDRCILLAMPGCSPFYEKTLAINVKNILENELGYKVTLPGLYSAGNWFRNLINDITKAKFCIIDSTDLSQSEEILKRKNSSKYHDYLHRLFILGISVGFRKTILHCYNNAFNRKMFTDFQGNCHFKYADTNLFEEIKKRVPEVFI